MARNIDIIPRRREEALSKPFLLSEVQPRVDPQKVFFLNRAALPQRKKTFSERAQAFLGVSFNNFIRPLKNRYFIFKYRFRVFRHYLFSEYRFLSHPVVMPFRFFLKPARLSILLAVFFGMGAMQLFQGIFNQSVSADRDPIVNGASQEREFTPEDIEHLLRKGFDEGGFSEENAFELEVLSQFVEEEKQEKFEDEVRRLVKGYPIEEMLPYIFEKDRITATFLIGIGKKESNWGRRVPVLEGQDCYNYWGFREKRRLMGTGGHTCFNSRKDAVDSVAHRIERLIFEYERDTPKEMIVWKCGYSCAGHSPESVRKWISDVEGYYQKLNEVGEE